MSAPDWAILAACAQVIVVVIVSVRTIRGRFRDVYQNGVRVRDIAVSTEGYTVQVRKLQANLGNQFETPIYFFAVILFGLYLSAIGPLFAGLAWVYVVSRMVHSFIHTGYNNILHRMIVFLTGGFAIIGMWLIVAVTVLGA